MCNVPYASAIGSLIYVLLCTWPNICFAFGSVSCYQSNLGPAYWQAVRRIFRHQRDISNLVICYQNGGLRLRGYSDAD